MDTEHIPGTQVEVLGQPDAPKDFKAAPGAPSKLTQTLGQNICAVVAAGNYMKTAAELNGIDPGTVGRWLQKGAMPEADPMYVWFRNEMAKAKAMAQARAVQHIQRAAADGQWPAAAWFLERTAPEDWGKKDRLEITGKDGGDISIAIAPDDEAIANLAARLAARQRGDTEELDEGDGDG